VQVYPNPASGAFTVVVSLPAAQKITLLMKDLQGKTVFVRSLSGVSSFSERVSLVGVSPGLYIISLRSGENSTSKSVLVTR
jgi:hypothetical protein